jgi:hypothetical protein
LRKVLVIFLVLCLGASAWAQSIDLQEVDLSMIELDKADLSQVEFYFNGPAQFLVRDVYYDGMYYAAVLDYDGRGTFSIKVPNSTSVQGLPMSLDLSEIDVSMTQQGLRLRNVVADGYRFSGELVPNPQLALEIDPPVVVLGPVKEQMAVASTDTADLQEQVSELQSDIRSLERQVSQKERAVSQREDEIESKNREINRLERRIADLETGPAGPSVLRRAAELDRTVKSGFSGGQAVLGDWRASRSRLTQTDADQLYAKYVVPVRQSSSEILYQFSGSSTGTGWQGFGLHFLGSEATLAEGYGYGSSYLVWITRDPAFTQTDQTFVQLYKSFDDVRMVQLASQAIDMPISRNMDVAVYVDRNAEKIHIGINNEPVIEFMDANMYRRGTAVAARALGSAQFRGLTVNTK